MPRLFAVLLLATFVVACTKETPESERIPISQMQAAGGDAQAGLSGTVLEQLPAGQYLYLRLKTAEGETWAAVSATTVEPARK